MKTIKTILRVTKRTAFGILFFLLVYVLAAFSLSKITVNTDADKQPKEVTLYLKTNGVHTDIILPLKNEIKDWSQDIKVANTKANDTIAKYLAFGWGDKGFYLDTPEWSDLKCSTAFNAAFALGSAAMHTTFYHTPAVNKDCVKLRVSGENYQKLVTYIEDSFQLDENHKPIFINAVTYGRNDSFYEAKGKYNLFHTCNSWANEALKSANQKAALWTVTDTGIFCHYQ